MIRQLQEDVLHHSEKVSNLRVNNNTEVLAALQEAGDRTAAAQQRLEVALEAQRNLSLRGIAQAVREHVMALDFNLRGLRNVIQSVSEASLNFSHRVEDLVVYGRRLQEDHLVLFTDFVDTVV